MSSVCGLEWHKMENLGLDLGAIEGEMFGFCEQNKNLVAFVSTCKNPSKRICKLRVAMS